jgi:hypothetical protein
MVCVSRVRDRRPDISKVHRVSLLFEAIARHQDYPQFGNLNHEVFSKTRSRE